MSEVALQLLPKDSEHVLRLLQEDPQVSVAIDRPLEQLRLVQERRRPFCCIYVFESPQSTDRLKLLVKVPVGHSDLAFDCNRQRESWRDRPRLFDRVEPETKAAKEYAALKRIQNHLEAKPDERFGVVKVYGLLAPQQTLVMQWIEESSLRTQLYQAHRCTSAMREGHLVKVFRNCGAWLRFHHQLPPLNHCQKRGEKRDDLLQSTERFIGYLTDAAGHDSFLREVRLWIDRAASTVLSAGVPTGQVHGDFAPRNVFVMQQARVAVFDTLGRFEAPIYEDIAKMLISIHASGPQLLSAGLLYSHRRLQRFEDAFLQGYFDNDPIPRSAIRLYTAQQLLESWAAVVYRHQQQRGLKRVAKALRRRIWERGIQDYLQRLLNEPVDTGSELIAS